MQKCLYLLCPTDCLESVINSNFENENYFYTSLGNSVVFTPYTIQHIKKLITKRKIKNIYFVLSDNNNIVLDALGKQNYSKLRGLNNFYTKITAQKKHTEILWQNDSNRLAIISYYLNRKIKELHFELINSVSHPVKIGGKIYDRFENTFKNIHSTLVCIEKHYLN